MPSDDDAASDLIDFIDASPSPYHAVATAVRRLESDGFRPLDESGPWTSAPGRFYVAREGSLVAWTVEGDDIDPLAGFRIVGAHTDSPNLRVKPHADTTSAGWHQLGVEVYGGVLLNSWLNRDLGLSGRVAVRHAGGVELRLVHSDDPLLTVPQLAIHLDRGVNDGLALNPQRHLAPVWGLDPVVDLRTWLSDQLEVPADDILAWELMAHAIEPGRLLGAERELVSAGRLDNLVSCWAAVRALSTPAGAGLGDAPRHVPLICLFDHEEVGSESATGAGGPLLGTVLERIVLAEGGDRESWHRSMARSFCVSADGAHATHPNYPERHEPEHGIEVNGGPVLKINSNVRYASTAATSGMLALAAERAGVPLQRFVVRTDLPCGSTIGPITAGRLGIPTVDCGVPQLSMHAARELCGAHDPGMLARLLAEFLGTGP